MIPSSDCTRAQAALQALLTEGLEPNTSDLEHLSTCPICRATAQRIQTLLSPISEPTLSPEGSPRMDLHDELKRQSARHLGFQMFGVTLLAGGFTAFWAWALKDPSTGWSWLVALSLLGLTSIPALLVLLLSRVPRKFRMYRRLGEGRMVSGVCLGLAERTHTPVWVWRVGTLAGISFFSDAALLYFLMAFTMPVHPEDRAGLLRFRIARWLRGLRMGGARTA